MPGGALPLGSTFMNSNMAMQHVPNTVILPAHLLAGSAVRNSATVHLPSSILHALSTSL